MEHRDQECQCEGLYCKKCQKTQCVKAFKQKFSKYKDKQYIYLICISCESKRKREWERKNPERVKATDKKYRAQYLKTHPYRSRSASQEILASHKRWRENNSERYRALQVSIKARRRAKQANNGGFYSAQQWVDLKAQYEYTCLRCGKKEPEIKLTADHIIPVFKGGTSYIDNIQPLCHSCNSSKGTKVIDFRPQKP